MRADRSSRYGVGACAFAASLFLSVSGSGGLSTRAGTVDGEAAANSDASGTLRMTCSVHGVANMTLQCSRESGAGRTVEITGTASGARWTVKVDGTDVTPATQSSASPGQVKLHTGDKVTWTVTGSNHGIVFP